VEPCRLDSIGAERIVSYRTNELVRLRHDVAPLAAALLFPAIGHNPRTHVIETRSRGTPVIAVRRG
jgi:hypothetical protein